MIREYIDRIEFEESFYSEEYQTVTMYFTAPVELLDGKYPDAVSAEISIEFPCADDSNFYPRGGSVEIAATGEHGDGLLDYDWHHVDLPYDEIELLLGLYDKWCDEHGCVKNLARNEFENC